MAKDTKLIRGQLRQVVQEMLPEMLMEQLYKQLEHKLALRMEVIEKFVKERMEAIDQRHKDSMSYMIRNVTAPPKAGDKE